MTLMWGRVLIAIVLLAGLCFASQAQFNFCKPGFCQQTAAGGTVTFDTSSTIANSVTSTTFDYATGVTVNASATLIVAYIMSQSQNIPSAVTWDQGGANQAMTSIGSVAANSTIGSAFIYCVTSPATGTNQTLRVNAGGNNDRWFASISSWKGTNTVVGTACKNFNSAKTAGGGNTDTSKDVTITSASGHAVTVGAGTDISNDASFAMDNTQLSTQLSAITVGTARASGAASVNIGIGAATAGNLFVAGIDVSP